MQHNGLEIRFTNHAIKQWAWRFPDLGPRIEDHFSIAKPASKKERQEFLRRHRRNAARIRESGDKPIFFVTRDCVFPAAYRESEKSAVILTVFSRTN